MIFLDRETIELSVVSFLPFVDVQHDDAGSIVRSEVQLLDVHRASERSMDLCFIDQQ